MRRLRGRNGRKLYRVIFAGVEGASEQAFLKWIERLCDELDIRVRFKIQNSSGGSPRQIIDRAIRFRQSRTPAKNSLVLIDKDKLSDHEERELEQLAKKYRITLIIQRPNFEGVLLRLHPGEETRRPSPEAVEKTLGRFWPNYEKPPTAQELGARFGLENLVSLAKFDEDIASLLKLIGL